MESKIDIGLEYEGYKINIPNVEDIFKSKVKKTIDDKINEALEVFDEQRDMNKHEQELYKNMLNKDEVVKENVF